MKLRLVAAALTVLLGAAAMQVPMADSVAAAHGVDFRSGIIKYVLDEPLIEDPNTFESWIKVEEDAEGEIGVIFGNGSVSDTPSVEYAVNAEGQLTVNWNNYERYIVFDKTDVRTGEWTFVSVVRRPSSGSFDCYIDGKPVQTVSGGAGSSNLEFYREPCIGSDFNNQTNINKSFNGRIRQVTLYSDALNEAEIARDRDNGNAIRFGTRDDLLFNVRLDPTKTVQEDTSLYCNDARLGSNDYYYEDELYPVCDYTLAVIPDMQMITNHYQKALPALFDYLLAEKETRKIAAAITVGDITDGITNGKDWDRQYNAVKKQFTRLDDEIPYIIVPGNHDYDNECKTDHSLGELNKAFPIEKISAFPYWGGSQDPDNVVNSYYLFEFAGVKYLMFSIDFGPSDDTLDWACRITEQYPDCRVIVSTHGFLTGFGKMLYAEESASPASYGWNGKTSINNADEMWEKWLCKYPNIFMVLCGHVGNEDIIVREYVGENGNVVSAFMVNAQTIVMNSGLDSLVGLFGFDEREQKIYVNYYSTIHDKLYNYQNQFVYDFYGNTDILSTLYYSD